MLPLGFILYRKGRNLCEKKLECERKKCGIGNSVNMKTRKFHKTKKLQSKRKAV